MDLETRSLASFIGRIISDARNIVDRTHADRFVISRGAPDPKAYPHALFLTEPLDCTTAALVVEEVNQAFTYDPRHAHAGRSTAGEGPQVVYLAWSGAEYPGRRATSAAAHR